MRAPRAVEDHLIRRKAGFHKIDPARFTVRIARTTEDYEQAFRLLHIAYAWQGIESLDAPVMRITDQHLLPESTVLVCYEGDQLVGTMTVTTDSPAGLPLDNDYGARLCGFRKRGERIAELGSFGIVGRCHHSGVCQLLSLAAARFSFGWLGVDRLVIGIHPKAAPFYRALWGFGVFGEPRDHAESHGTRDRNGARTRTERAPLPQALPSSATDGLQRRRAHLRSASESPGSSYRANVPRRPSPAGRCLAPSSSGSSSKERIAFKRCAHRRASTSNESARTRPWRACRSRVSRDRAGESGTPGEQGRE